MADEYKNLVEVLTRSVSEHFAQELFGTKRGATWEWITYGEFNTLVDEFRGGLAALGVGSGDKVAIISNNRVEWATAAYATYGRGASYVPMYEAQLPKEWKFILQDSGAKVVIAATTDIFKKLKEIQSELSTLEHVINMEGDASDEESMATVSAKGNATPAAAIEPATESVAGFIYTSGTTGQPKGVMLSHANVCSNLNALHTILPFEGERSLAFLPWAHSFGQTCELHSLVSSGCSLAINDDVANLVANLSEVKPTVLYAVPRVFNRIYDGVHKQMKAKPAPIQKLFHAGIKNATKVNNGEPIGLLAQIGLNIADKIIFTKVRERFGGRLSMVVSGSAALSTDVAKFIDALGIKVYEGYGLTETSPITSTNFPDNRKIGSVGKAIPGVTVTIDRKATDGHDDGKSGEILVKGPNIMLGYHNRAEENEKVLMEDRTFRTGDLGYLDSDGYLYITGRIKEQYKLENGKYVSPAVLEESLKLSPFIANVMLHGMNKPHNVALVVADAASVKEWAAEEGISVGDIVGNPEVEKLIEREVASFGGDFKGFERPKKCLVITDDFTTENEMLTQSMKLKRRNVMAKYGEALDALYE